VHRRQGFEELRLRDVASEVGIDHSTLHHHYATKQDLVAGVVEHAAQQFWPSSRRTGAHASGSTITSRPWSG
jgi:AcrR family transcriptional regulator